MINISHFPSHARVWLYQSNRPLTTAEVNSVKPILDKFVNGWKCHGSKLAAEAHILYNRFIMLIVDEEIVDVSGCSIDRSTRFLSELGNQLGVDFFNRMVVYYKSGDNIDAFHFSDFDALLKIGKISMESQIFNIGVSTKQEFDQKWLVPIKESWLAQYAAEV